MPGLRRAGVAAALLLSSPAIAQESQKGMPQLDFGNPLLISQVIWGAIIFAMFYILASRWALPKMGAVLEHRASVIQGDLETARRAKVEADAAVASLHAERRRSAAEASGAIERATAEAKQFATSAAAEVNAKLESQLTDAEGRIAAARNSAMGALREVASETAVNVVSRLTGRPADRAVIDGAVGDAMLAKAA